LKAVFRIRISLNADANADPHPGFYLNADADADTDPDPDMDSGYRIRDPDPRFFCQKNKKILNILQNFEFFLNVFRFWIYITKELIQNLFLVKSHRKG